MSELGFCFFGVYENKTSIFISLLQVFVACGQADVNISVPDQTNYTLELVVPNLEIPWGIAYLPDNSLLITEKQGKLIHFKNGKKTSIKNIPNTYVRGQGGLMGIATHPDFEDNNIIYFTQSSSVESEESGGNTASIVLFYKTMLYKMLRYCTKPNQTPKGTHFGSRIVFDNDGYLYFTIGDRGKRDENPQDLVEMAGSISLNGNGDIPTDNPFVVKDAKTAVFSYGHRNPQGMTKHPVTGEIWTHEHGPRGVMKSISFKQEKLWLAIDHLWEKLLWHYHHQRQSAAWHGTTFILLDSIDCSFRNGFCYNSKYADWEGIWSLDH